MRAPRFSASAIAALVACGPSTHPDTSGPGIDDASTSLAGFGTTVGDSRPSVGDGPETTADGTDGTPSDDDCPVGTWGCKCGPEQQCEEGLYCIDHWHCAMPSCVDQPSPLSEVTLVEDGVATTLDVAWFDYWQCSLFGGFVVMPQGIEFDSHSTPEGGRMIWVDEPRDWWAVADGEVFAVTVETASGRTLESNGTLEVVEIGRDPGGHPIYVDATITAQTTTWSLEGTFHATDCGDGFGPGFPCE